VLVSRRPVSRDLQRCLDDLEQACTQVELIRSGSAVKFCQLVAGEADFYPRFSPCSEWDIAAGDAVLQAAGGALLGLDGKQVLYNRRDTLLSPNFYAFADPGHELWRQLLRWC
jgi:3'(2'), 5'-bisphosphate nucleotidase